MQHSMTENFNQGSSSLRLGLAFLGDRNVLLPKSIVKAQYYPSSIRIGLV